MLSFPEIAQHRPDLLHLLAATQSHAQLGDEHDPGWSPQSDRVVGLVRQEVHAGLSRKSHCLVRDGFPERDSPDALQAKVVRAAVVMVPYFVERQRSNWAPSLKADIIPRIQRLSRAVPDLEVSSTLTYLCRECRRDGGNGAGWHRVPNGAD